MAGQQLARREEVSLEKLEQMAGGLIRTPQELAARVRAMQEVAHVLSPAIAVSSIAPHYTVNTAVVVIDTALPAAEFGSAAGNDVYFQSSIHKGDSSGRGDDRVTTPREVSLNKTGLIKILSAAGIDVTRSERTDDKKDPYFWAWTSEGEIIDFDGRRRKLPPGDVEIDYRDGSAQIGEWTPQEWAKRVAAADVEKAKVDKRDQWKVKPQAINGFSEDRVRNARRFGLRIAQAESLNRLIRNLGIKQKYTLEELQKPFVIFRVSYEPDMNDPETRRIVTAANMGAAHLLFGHGQAAPGTAREVIDLHSTPDAEVLDAAQPHAAQAMTSTPTSAAAPEDAEEIDDIPDEPTPVAALPTYTFVKVRLYQREGEPARYFFDTAEGKTFLVEDRELAKRLNEDRKNKTPLQIDAGVITFEGQQYAEILEMKASTTTLPPKGSL